MRLVSSTKCQWVMHEHIPPHALEARIDQYTYNSTKDGAVLHPEIQKAAE